VVLDFIDLDETKTPLVLVACGSYSPVTYLHLRMFEMGYDYICGTDFEVMGAYFSPVSNAYQKPGLAEWYHRVNMCSLAVQDSTWIMCDSWEPSQPQYVTTAKVLDHFDEQLNGGEHGGVDLSDGMLLSQQRHQETIPDCVTSGWGFDSILCSSKSVERGRCSCLIDQVILHFGKIWMLDNRKNRSGCS
jgi:hypothetical protein